MQQIMIRPALVKFTVSLASEQSIIPRVITAMAAVQFGKVNSCLGAAGFCGGAAGI